MTRSLRNPDKRHTPEEIHARLIFIIGLTLAFVFAMSILVMLWSLVFVTQPIEKHGTFNNPSAATRLLLQPDRRLRILNCLPVFTST